MKIAVVAHVYYPELWEEIAAYLRRWPSTFHLYVTTPPDRCDNVRSIVCHDFPKTTFFPAANRGRDIGPFIEALPWIIADGREVICKLHTKKSGHWEHGASLRKSLYKGLLDFSLQDIERAFAKEPTLGILAPAGHLIPHRVYWEDNRERVMQLAGRLGAIDNLLPFRFPAGSMFWARTAALEPLFKLCVRPADFPDEQGQYNGTLAHALERLFPLAARIAGYETADTTSLRALMRHYAEKSIDPWWVNEATPQITDFRKFLTTLSSSSYRLLRLS